MNTQVFQEIKSQINKKASRRQEEMIACSYQDLFPYINDALHGKWNSEWNEKDDKLKQIKLDTRSWKENKIFK